MSKLKDVILTKTVVCAFFLYTKTTTNMDLTFILNNPGLFLFSVGFI